MSEASRRPRCASEPSGILRRVGIDARTHLTSLVGGDVYTLTNSQRNRVMRIEGDEVIVGTDKSPEGRPVPIEWVQTGIDLLEQEGEVEVTVESLGHRGAFVAAVLATLPGAVVKPTTPRRVALPTVDRRSTGLTRPDDVRGRGVISDRPGHLVVASFFRHSSDRAIARRSQLGAEPCLRSGGPRVIPTAGRAVSPRAGVAPARGSA